MATKQSSQRSRLSPARGSALSCGPDCGHTELEHRAFDLGLRDGERGKSERIPRGYRWHDFLKEAWLTGHSVGTLNRRAQNRRMRDGGQR